MNEREKIIRLWFDMWLKQQDLGIDKIFTEDVVYTESWCPKYENLKTVKHWFNEWNTRGKVIIWDIKQFFHKENQTVVEWYAGSESLKSWPFSSYRFLFVETLLTLMLLYGIKLPRLYQR